MRDAWAGMVLLLLVAGCNGESQEQARLETTETLLQQPTADRETHYRCADGTELQTRYEPATDTLVVFLPDRATRLNHARSASGARYRGAGLMFWNQGDSALLQRNDADAVHCQAIDAPRNDPQA